MTVLAFIIGIATGILSGFGVGGGSLLVLYLTAFAGTEPSIAGGINLLYFIGCAPAALIGHIRNRLIAWPAVLWCTLAGMLTAPLASIFAQSIDTSLLRRLFGVFLIVIGTQEWRAARKNK